MDKRHEQSTVPDSGKTVFKGGTVDRNILAQSDIIAYNCVRDDPRLEPVILRIIADYCSEIDPASGTYGSMGGDLDVGIDYTVVPD